MNDIWKNKHQHFEKDWWIDNEDKVFLKGYRWYINSSGYICRSPKMINYKYEKIERYLHRLIIKAKKGQIIDHINNNKLDNRKINLRIVTSRQNCLNRKNTNNKTGFRGVQKVGRKFKSYISIYNKTLSLGYYNTPQEASQVYNKFYEQSFV